MKHEPAWRPNNKKIINLKIAIIITLTLATAIFWIHFKIFEFFLYPKPIYLLPLVTYGILVFVYLPSRIILYLLYQPYEYRGYLPPVSVVVPAFNEGPSIRETLVALIKADYPDKQIIVIDDGSTDDTYRHIRSVQREYPDELEVYRFRKNRGKREAMARGVRKSRGEIIIFIDSDTVVDKDALKYLAAPFEDARVGGVTGKVKVKNKNTNLLTRMLSVRYVMSFDFYRSSRSAYGGVMCLSGVISAYRKSILDEIVPEWLEQEFMGGRCTFGDDRSLTNYILKNGFNTVYSRKARAMTIVPETVPKLMRMLTRWNKSFIRESLIMLGYLVKPANLRKRKMLLFDFIMTSFMTIFIVFVVSFMVFRIMQDMFLTINFLGSISLMSMIYMTFYIRTERDWYFLYGIVYSFFYMFVLIWILPYALFTIKRNSWGTR